MKKGCVEIKRIKTEFLIKSEEEEINLGVDKIIEWRGFAKKVIDHKEKLNKEEKEDFDPDVHGGGVENFDTYPPKKENKKEKD